MGRQLNFWMTQSDEFAFVDRLRQDDVVSTPRALEYRDTPTIHELDEWSPNVLATTLAQTGINSQPTAAIQFLNTNETTLINCLRGRFVDLFDARSRQFLSELSDKLSCKEPLRDVLNEIAK